MKKLNKSIVFLLIFLIAACASIQIKNDKMLLISYKKMYLQERKELILTDNISEEKIKTVYAPMIEGMGQKLNILLEQGKTIDSVKDKNYPEWKHELYEFQNELIDYKVKFEKEKRGE